MSLKKYLQNCAQLDIIIRPGVTSSPKVRQRWSFLMPVSMTAYPYENFSFYIIHHRISIPNDRICMENGRRIRLFQNLKWKNITIN